MTRCCGGIVALLCVDHTHSVHADCAAHCCTPTCLLFVLLLCMYAALLLHHPTYDSMRHVGMKLLCFHTLCGCTDVLHHLCCASSLLLW